MPQSEAEYTCAVGTGARTKGGLQRGGVHIRMLVLGPRLGFEVLDFAFGLVDQAALIQLGIGAAPGGDLPDYLTIFVLLAFFDTGISGVCVDRVFFAMQQFRNLGDVGYIGCGAMDVVHQARLSISTDMGLHPEEILVTFLGLMHLGIALSVFVFGRTGGMNNSGIHDGALAQREALFLQITVDDRKDRRCQLVLFQQMPEVHDRSVFGARRAQGQVCELAHGGDFVERFFQGRIAQAEPVLQKMDA